MQSISIVAGGQHVATTRLVSSRSSLAARRPLSLRVQAAVHGTGCSGGDATAAAGVFSMASRRVALLAAASGILVPLPSDASALGDFWRSRQTQNGGAKILAPIRVARGRLQGALEGLGESPTAEDYKKALGVVRPSSFNCYIYQVPDTDSLEAKASVLQQKYGGAVEVCTFKLILKNVVLNIKDKTSDLPKVASAACEELISMFSLLDMKLDSASQLGDVQESEIRQAFQDTIAAADAFDLSIQKCLGVA